MLTDLRKEGSFANAAGDLSPSAARALSAFFIASIVAVIAAGSWGWLNRPLNLQDAPERISGFAYSGFQRDQDPTKLVFPNARE